MIMDDGHHYCRRPSRQKFHHRERFGLHRINANAGFFIGSRAIRKRGLKMEKIRQTRAALALQDCGAVSRSQIKCASWCMVA